MTSSVDIREAAECSCMRLRRTTRRVTQLYDRLLAEADLTVTQFTILVWLYNRDARSVGRLAARIGADPTTLNRNLKPLLKRRLVRTKPDPEDHRTHAIFITETGRKKVHAALPLWRRAQDELAAACGVEATQQLNALLDVSYGKLAD